MEDQFVEDALHRALELTKEVDQTLRPAALGAVLRSLLAAAQGAAPPVPAAGRAEPVQRQTVVENNLNEFLPRVDPRSHPQRVVAIAYHALHTGNENGLTTTEFIDAYKRARETRPKNMSDVIATCFRRGFLIDASQRKEGANSWVITKTGEVYLEAGFQES